MNNIEVGKPYSRIVGKDGGCYADHPDGFEIVVNYAGVTDEEADAYKVGKKFEIRFATVRGILFFLFRAEGQPWQEAPFAPGLAPNNDYPELEEGEGYLLTLIVSDCPSGIVKVIRGIGLGTKFSQALRDEIMSLKTKPFNSITYVSELNGIYRAYSTKDLLRFTSARYEVSEDEQSITFFGTKKVKRY